MKTDTLTRDYHAHITAAVPAHKAFEAICRVKAWWANNLTGESQKLGDVFTVRFGETFVTFRLAEVVPDKKIVWHVMDCNLHWVKDKKEWKGTDVVFEISADKDLTRIYMTHVGLVPEAECFENCQGGWNHFIKESLLQLITEGTG